MREATNNDRFQSYPSEEGNIQWNANLYDNKHNFVAKYGEDVLEWLAPQQGEHILDVGCGTGTLTNKLSESGAIVTGIDASQEMIAKAKASFPNIKFFEKDATNFSFDEQFDAAFSNATLHWIHEQKKALQRIYNALKKEGRFVFEMGGKHNIESIHTAVKEAMTEVGYKDLIPSITNYFPSVADQCLLLEKVGFAISDVAYFKRPTELNGEDGMKNWIVQFCTFFFANIPAEKVNTIINRAVEILKPANYKEGKWYGDYIRLRIKAIKE
ncbi:MAG: methyltransferase domain-containing protein [Bacteroidota bacterium]|nr:methyltransferase domain-containing protein [Bacteroidota bacterium]